MRLWRKMKEEGGNGSGVGMQWSTDKETAKIKTLGGVEKRTFLNPRLLLLLENQGVTKNILENEYCYLLLLFCSLSPQITN
jgi:hypothetical protein